jgi:dinuclear metal center YbgI/SA1388 family protein
MIRQFELKKYLHDLLGVDAFKDYCPNGMIVEGSDDLYSGITGVSFTLDLVKTAIAKKSDFILVHHPHGFWKGQNQTLTGPHKTKIKLLLENNISLWGYHLPMDAHPIYGNNACLAKAIGATPIGGFMKEGNKYIGLKLEFPEPISIDSLLEVLEKEVGIPNFTFLHGKQYVHKIALCTGSAPNQVEEVLEWADVYITGEARENTQYLIQENNLHFIAAGHHQTERFGPRALGNHIAEKFGLKVEFIDIVNPV